MHARDENILPRTNFTRKYPTVNYSKLLGMLRWCKKRSPYHWDEFHTHAFHVAPSMGPIVLVVNLQDRKNSL